MRLKILLMVAICFLVAGLFLFNKPLNANAGATGDAYKSVVKIKSFILNPNYKLTNYSQGSGVLISSSGLILTNHHVAVIEDSFDDSELDSVYQICLSESVNEAPNCSYVAQLVSSDADNDIAILKIKNVSGLGDKTTFPYLNINQSSDVNISDALTVMGYPLIGGDTITITEGIVSGKSNQHNSSWIKTDAVISFGSSGGAAINSNNEIVGLTSSAHADTLGSLGYLVDVSSLSSWIASNKLKSPRGNSLFSRLVNLTKNEQAYNASNTFYSESPSFSITKDAGWDFDLMGENDIFISQNNDQDQGGIGISIVHYPYLTSLDDVIPSLKKYYSDIGYLSIMEINDKGNVTINGNEAKKIESLMMGTIGMSYEFPVDNYFIEVGYDYGVDDVSKDAIDNMINSLTISRNSHFVESHNLTGSVPRFSISTSNNWAVMDYNSQKEPFRIIHKNIKDAVVSVTKIKLSGSEISKTNEDLLSDTLQAVIQLNQYSASIGASTTIVESNAHHSLNNELSDVVMIEGENKKLDSIYSRSLSYFVRSGDYYISISLRYFGDLDLYGTSKTEFNSLIQTLSLLDASQVATPTSYFTVSGNLIKVSGNSAVYEIGDDGKKYLFSNSDTFWSHYSGSWASLKNNGRSVTIREISQSDFDDIDRGSNIKIKSGSKIVKFDNSPRIYVVYGGAKLKQITEDEAQSLFGVNWQGGIAIIQVAFEADYTRSNGSFTDSDNDGISDIDEQEIYNTDPNDFDSDNDGHKDGKEVISGYNPNGAGLLI